MADNITTDVSNIKGIAGGYSFSAPTGTAAGTTSDPFATLDPAFENLGYISEDGVEEESDTDTEEVVDLNGDVVCVLKSKESEKLTLTFISTSKAALCEMFGHGNVTEETDWLEVRHTVKDHDIRAYVFDFVLKDTRRWRKVVPLGQVVELGSIVYAGKEVFGRKCTIQCYPDASGVRIYDYIQKAATATAGE